MRAYSDSSIKAQKVGDSVGHSTQNSKEAKLLI